MQDGMVRKGALESPGCETILLSKPLDHKSGVIVHVGKYGDRAEVTPQERGAGLRVCTSHWESFARRFACSARVSVFSHCGLVSTHSALRVTVHSVLFVFLVHVGQALASGGRPSSWASVRRSLSGAPTHFGSSRAFPVPRGRFSEDTPSSRWTVR